MNPQTPEQIADDIQNRLQVPWLGVRPDLVLYQGPSQDGKATYVLADPARGLHFELEEPEMQLFMCLAAEADIASAVRRFLHTTPLKPKAEDLMGFIFMLQAEKLAILPAQMAVAAETLKSGKTSSLWMKFISSYLFFRIPLLRPDPLLTRLLPFVRPLWSKGFVFAYAVLGVVGLIFMLPQIELYLHTVNHLFTPKGALGFFVALAIVKSLHELGHGFTAKHYGLFVRRMGIAFMVFIPLLYTDTTEAWTLPSRRQRMMVSLAGILTEVCIAGLALFFWAVLPDGVLRSLMFYLSGASLTSTLLTNLNPLMRYDGHYVLMDYLGVSNLHKRSAAMFKYYAHRLLVDWQAPPPEEHPHRRGLAIFGAVVFIYRIMILAGITLTIYHKVFKALGVILVLIQIVMVVVVPIVMEMMFLIKNRAFMGSRFRIALTAGLLVLGLGALFWPRPGIAKLPGLFLLDNVVRVKSPSPGQIVSDLPEIGTNVTKGDVLIRIHSPALDQEYKDLGFELAKVEATIGHLGSGGVQGGYRQWLIAEQARIAAALAKLEQALAQLQVRAPISGTVVDLNETLAKGSHLAAHTPILVVGNDRTCQVRAYANEKSRLSLPLKTLDQADIFFKDLKTGKCKGRLRDLQPFPVREFPSQALFEHAGGPIVATRKKGGVVVARQAYYPLIYDVPANLAHPPHGAPCTVRLKGRAVSPAREFIGWAWTILAAEGLV